ncbi:major facilitator superfamily domain-containing protein [Amylocarpus encephaloides]|uniref:Major facilitator superfamily domain-containing protein n=1 Tax=Amylocarpus encephaloides TaxID=45428 RepID=A0A9P8C8C8_9HELO|nr:major facilitator superfamily domain-containing protein [Amylocarpus encephaloides]
MQKVDSRQVSDDEKGHISQKEVISPEDSSDTYPQAVPTKGAIINADDDDSGPHFDTARTKTLLRKLDWHLVPFLSLLYLLSFLDRTNIGNAKLFNLQRDLGMPTKGPDAIQYNIAVAIFFPFYVAAEVPSNMMMKRTRPSLWLTIIMIAWAVCTIGMGFVKDFKDFVIVRALLGVCEGGLFPGVTYYITMWYARHECGFRMALFFSAATAAGAFGGILAYAIGKMDGVGGRGGWSWIFILEGLLTLAVAFVAYWAINDYPRTAKFLSEEERTEVERRLKVDRSSLADEFNLKFAKDAFKDWKIYVHMLITIGIYTPLYSISVFLPTIIKNMGNGQYSAEASQLLTVPPYVVACIFTIGAGWLADKTKQRGLYMIFFEFVAIIGFIMLASSGKAPVQYIGTFLATSGIYPLVPMGVAWNGNNIGGSLKRGVGIAMHVGFGNLGGAISAFCFLAKYSPRFIPGLVTLASTCTMSLVLSVCMHFYLKTENARRDRWAIEHNMHPGNYTEEQKVAEREMGDNATFFRYTV